MEQRVIDTLVAELYGCGSPLRWAGPDAQRRHSDADFETVRITLDMQREALEREREAEHRSEFKARMSELEALEREREAEHRLEFQAHKSELDALEREREAEHRSELKARMSELEVQRRLHSCANDQPYHRPREVLRARQAEYVHAGAPEPSPGRSRERASFDKQLQEQEPPQQYLIALAQRELELVEMSRERDAALRERDLARQEGSAAVALLKEALEQERSDHEATDLLLSDASEYVDHLKQTCLKFEATIRCLQRSLHEHQARAATSSPSSGGEASNGGAEQQQEQQPLLGMTHTRNAIEAAVKEAAALPEDERKRKIRGLRAKWHPDKHDILKEMTSEVTKLINAAVDEHIVDGGS